MSVSEAAIFSGMPGQMTLQQFPLPQLRGAEVLVRVLGCTVCGSDVHTYDGRRSVPVPTVLGHEIVGEIIAFGPAASRIDIAGQSLQIGDRITWAIVAHCGHCPMCESGLPQKCQHAVKYGHEALRPGEELLGGFAEHCLLVAGTSIVRIPDQLPLEVACPASCATATVVAALEAAGEIADRHICLFGAGTLGLTACARARSLGAATIVCVDPAPARREKALQFGATQAVSPEEFANTAKSLPGAAGYDVAVELSGNAAAFHAAWAHLRIGGTLVLVGSVFPGEPVPIALEQIVRRHLTIRGIHNYAPRHLATAIEFLSAQQRQFPFAQLVTSWYPLTEIEQAFERSLQPDAIRVGVRP